MPDQTPTFSAAASERAAQLDREAAQVDARENALNERVAANARAADATLTPMEDDLKRAMAEPLPAPPQAAERPAVPDLAKAVDPQQYQGLAFALLGLSLLGGAASRGNWQGALATLNGALKGAKEGRDQDAQRLLTEYDRKFKAAQDHDAAANDAYQKILDNRKLTVNEKIERMRVEAARFQRQDLLAEADRRSIDGLIRQVDAGRNALNGALQRNSAVQLHVHLAQDKAAGDPNALLQPDEIAEMAQQYLAGDKSVMQNLGRGKQGAENIVKLRRAIADEAKRQGLSGADIAVKLAEFEGLKSGERSLGTRTAQAGMAVNESVRLADLATKANHAVPRTSFVPFNKAEQAWQAGTGDTHIVRFIAATNSFINAYARAISPTGQPTISDKDHAREVISTAQSQEQYDAVIDQLLQEARAAQQSPADTQGDLRAMHGGASSASSAAHPADIDALVKKYANP